MSLLPMNGFHRPHVKEYSSSVSIVHQCCVTSVNLMDVLQVQNYFTIQLYLIKSNQYFQKYVQVSNSIN